MLVKETSSKLLRNVESLSALRDNRGLTLQLSMLRRPARVISLPEVDYTLVASGSLDRLGVDCIDLYYLHRYDMKSPIEETFAAFKVETSSRTVK